MTLVLETPLCWKHVVSLYGHILLIVWHVVGNGGDFPFEVIANVAKHTSFRAPDSEQERAAARVSVLAGVLAPGAVW